MTTSIDYLDSRTPIKITSGSKFFEDIAEHWGDSKTIVDLMKREAADQARFAFRSGVNALVGLKSAAQPYFEPRARPTFTSTAELQLLEERTVEYSDSETDVLIAIWDSENERPVANLTTRTSGFKYRMRQAKWAIVDFPKDVIDGIKTVWSSTRSWL